MAKFRNAKRRKNPNRWVVCCPNCRLRVINNVLETSSFVCLIQLITSIRNKIKIIHVEDGSHILRYKAFRILRTKKSPIWRIVSVFFTFYCHSILLPGDLELCRPQVPMFSEQSETRGSLDTKMSWRREGDSNPRDPLRSTVFPGLRTRPLCDLSNALTVLKNNDIVHLKRYAQILNTFPPCWFINRYGKIGR